MNVPLISFRYSLAYAEISGIVAHHKPLGLIRLPSSAQGYNGCQRDGAYHTTCLGLFHENVAVFVESLGITQAFPRFIKFSSKFSAIVSLPVRNLASVVRLDSPRFSSDWRLVITRLYSAFKSAVTALTRVIWLISIATWRPFCGLHRIKQP